MTDPFLELGFYVKLQQIPLAVPPFNRVSSFTILKPRKALFCKLSQAMLEISPGSFNVCGHWDLQSVSEVFLKREFLNVLLQSWKQKFGWMFHDGNQFVSDSLWLPALVYWKFTNHSHLSWGCWHLFELFLKIDWQSMFYTVLHEKVSC